jgi:hypothetical protein
MIETLTYHIPLSTHTLPMERPLTAHPHLPLAALETPELPLAWPTFASDGVQALPEPQACSPEVLQQVYPKLQSLERGLRSTVPTLAVEAPEALFDVYTLLRLLANVAQEQRDSARIIRKAYSAQAKIAIQQQADLQRSAT